MKKFFAITMLLVVCSSAGFPRDLRAVKVQKFLARYPDSPLRGHVHEILYCADRFGLDYRLYLAVAGAESTFGRRYPKRSRNLTGICNGASSFSSIYDNIYRTHEIIATGKWYRKYRKTKNIKDFVYVYKGVPPFAHYIRTLRAIFAGIDRISVEKERRQDRQVMLSELNPPGFKAEHQANLVAWNTTRYDKFASRQVRPFAQKPAKKVKPPLKKAEKNTLALE
ncbi:MAG: hypothetical protein PHG97_06820 [Candidatus Margulisbacteria bacterium]|nr:hypothetical protein [Candidatus Margulisiibacteriota bacterium]